MQALHSHGGVQSTIYGEVRIIYRHPVWFGFVAIVIQRIIRGYLQERRPTSSRAK